MAGDEFSTSRPSSAPPSTGRDAAWIAVLALAYFLAHEMAFLFPDSGKVLAAVWPAGGIGLAALLLLPRRRWTVLLLVLFLVGCTANLTAGRPLVASVGFMIANVIESLACASLIIRWRGEGVRFSRVADILALIVSATLVNAGTSLLGAATATLTGSSRFFDFWLSWWVADGLGILLITPVVIGLFSLRNSSRLPRWQRLAEAAVFTAVWWAAAWMTFQPADHARPLGPHPYMLFGLLLWPAMRFGPRGVAFALAGTAGLAVTSEAISTGPFLLGGADQPERLLAVQVYLGFTAAVGFLLSTGYAEFHSAERSSREDQARLRALADNLPNGMVYQLVRELDGRFAFQYVSAGVERLTGLSSQEVLSNSSALYQLVVEEDRPALAAVQESSFQNLTVFDVELRMRRPDGQIHWMHISSTPRRLPGGRTLWDGIQTDVTARRLAERALQENERLLRESQSAARIGSYVTDLNTGTWRASPETYTIFGIDESYPHTLDGWTELIHSESRAELLAYQQKAEAEKKRFDHEYKIVRVNDGDVRWVHAVGAWELNPEGNAVGIVGTVQDVTERKTLEAKFQQAQKMESIGRLAGGIAHEFNNLLTVINGYGQLAFGSLADDHPIRANLSEILKAGERAAGLTSQMLAYSRKQFLQPRQLNLNGVVQGMIFMLQRVVGDDVDVRVALSAVAGMVQADPHQLEQVLMNLVLNARDAMPAGGELLIETANAELDDHYVSAHPGSHVGNHIMLAVSDTGMGMDEETQRKIFEPFFTTKGVGKGTGLGLSMVQGIVAQSGGHLDVSSRPGHGTTFRIYLPALTEAAVNAWKPAANPAPSGEETVLLVEDEPGVRRYATAALEAYGYRVLQAKNREEALTVFGQERDRIHLVLTDMLMPNGSGPELAAELEIRQPGIKVLFMSAYTDEAIADRGLLYLGAEFIQKPFSPQLLAAKVRMVLEPK